MPCKEAASSQPYHQFSDRLHPPGYRQEEIAALKQAIQATENRLVLGLPDAGLSNLLRFLVTRIEWDEREVIFAYIDCDALDDCLDRDMFFAEIACQFCQQGVGDELREDMPGYQRLYRLLASAGGDRSSPLVIVVNKADRMVANAAGNFYRKLKSLADCNKRVCYIVAVSLEVADAVDPAEPLFAGRWLRAGCFNERDFAGAVVEEARRLGVKFSSEQREKLAQLTGGHPGLLRAISSAVVGESLDLSVSETALVERLLTRQDVRSRCLRVWQALTPVRQAVLRAVAREQPNGVAQDGLTWLQDFGLIVEYEGAYRLFSPLFQRFVADQEIQLEPEKLFSEPEQDKPLALHPPQGEVDPEQELKLECVTINKPVTTLSEGRVIIVAGKVFKGKQEVYVAPLELRFIACLKRERRVYTHSEIVEYVYYEEYAPGDGVPDDRLHNLARQVRKRLGKEYIKTYPRRGYEFIDGC